MSAPDTHSFPFAFHGRESFSMAHLSGRVSLSLNLGDHNIMLRFAPADARRMAVALSRAAEFVDPIIPQPVATAELTDNTPIVVAHDHALDHPTTWGQFCADNDELDEVEVRTIAETLARGQAYRGGGGAAGGFSLRRAA